MRLWRWGAAAVLGAMALIMAGCGLLSPNESYRYRVTVEVDTPQGLRTGSSVWETKATEGSGIPNTNLQYKGRGEAVVVDLPTGPIFALLRNENVGVDYPHNLITSHLGAHPDSSVQLTDDWRANRRAIKKARPSFELSPDEYPLLVRFRDINDPASVEKVDPANLAASFGPGVRIHRMTIAVTSDSVTEGIVERLPWLRNQRGSLLKMPPRTRRRDTPLAGRITEGDFVAGGL